MTSLDKIQELWNSQPDIETVVRADDVARKAEQHRKKIKYGHIGTIAILTVVVTILVGYFIWLGFSGWTLFTTGLSLMTGMLLWQIALESISVNRFSNIRPDNDLLGYTEKIAAFYTWRRKVHLVLTPIIYLSYIVGFVMLLSALKANLSTTMFWYCVISGSVFLTGFGIFLIYLIWKEIKMLDYLKGITANT